MMTRSQGGVEGSVRGGRAIGGCFWRIVCALWMGAYFPQAWGQIPGVDGFNPGANAWVECVAVQTDGRILVGGNFTSIAGRERGYLARLNPDATLDAGFDPQPNGFVDSIAILEDGRILVAGSFNQVGGLPCAGVARLHPDGHVDTSFEAGVGGGSYPQIYALIVQPDGKIVIGGGFTLVNGVERKRIARLNADGTLDETFNPGADDWVRCLALQEDGDLVLGGRFTSVAGKPRERLARLHPDGTLDETFQTGASGMVGCLVVQGDGRLVLGGEFITVGGFNYPYLARLEIDGSVDAGFLAHPSAAVDSICLLNGGQILAAGAFLTMNGRLAHRMARLRADGSLDEAFSAGANNRVRALTVLPDGRLLAAGWFTGISGAIRDRIARLEATGSASWSWNRDGEGVHWQGTALAPRVVRARFAHSPDGISWTTLGATADGAGGWKIEADQLPLDGLIRVHGWVSGSDSAAGWFLEDYFPLGRPMFLVQPEFTRVQGGDTAVLYAHALGVGSLTYQWSRDGVALVDGPRISGATSSRLMITQALASDVGTYELTVTNERGASTSLAVRVAVNLWVPEPRFVVSQGLNAGTLAVLPDGGWVTCAVQDGVVRFRPDGRRDDSTKLRANGAVNSVALVGDGRVLLGGNFSFLGNLDRSGLARLQTDGSVDLVFAPNLASRGSKGVDAVLVQPDGRLVVAGYFTGDNVEDSWGLVRVNSDGTLDPLFKPNVNVWADLLGMQPDGRILVNERYEDGIGSYRVRLIRMSSEGVIDAAFHADGNGRIEALAVLPDGRILIGGNFSEFGGVERRGLVRLLPDGIVDPAFAARVKGTVLSIAVLAGGRVLLGGEFSSVNGEPRDHLALLESDGALVSTFAPGTDGRVETVAVREDGTVLVSGWFSNVAGLASPAFAGLRPPSPSKPALMRDSGVLRWERPDGAPEFSRVAFEQSMDGHTWTLLGAGGRTEGGWELKATTMSEGGSVRARGWAVAGDGVSQWFSEAILGVPALLLEPLNQTRWSSQIAEFRVAAGGSEPLAYRWRKDGVSLIDDDHVHGCASPELVLKELLVSDEGGYSVVVSNDLGTITSRVARLSVMPTIPLAEVFAGSGLTWTTGGGAKWFGEIYPGTEDLGIARSGEMEAGESSWLETRVEGPGQVRYCFLDLLLPGSRFEFLIDGAAFPPTFVGDAFGWDVVAAEIGEGDHVLRWRCTASETGGGPEDLVRLRWVSFRRWAGPPVFTFEPRSATNDFHGSATFHAESMGALPMRYRWFKDGVALEDSRLIHGSGTETLFLEQTTGASAGVYHAVAENPLGTNTSQGATLVVCDPQIWRHPISRNLQPGESARFRVTIEGTDPLRYQWFKDGVALADGPRVQGGSTGELILGPVDPADAGTYRVIVRNAYGVVQSDECVLVINRVPLDRSFSAPSYSSPAALCFQQDGRILLGRWLNDPRDPTESGLVRLEKNGAPDLSFHGPIGVGVSSLVVDREGRVLLGGYSLTPAGGAQGVLMRVDQAGNQDGTFANSIDGRVWSLGMQADGAIVIAGDFTNVDGMPVPGLARLLPVGRLDRAFAPKIDFSPTCLAIQPNGKVLVGGVASSMNKPYGRLVRVLPDGALDPNFQASIDYNVGCLLLQRDGRVLVGLFSPPPEGAMTSECLLRLDSSGRKDASFHPDIVAGFGPSVNTLALQANGDLIVGGAFDAIEGQVRFNIAKILPDGHLDQVFSPWSWGSTLAVAVQNDGGILSGGGDATIEPPLDDLVRRMDPEPVLDRLSRVGDTVMWSRGGAAPEFLEVTFEHSLDGKSWSAPVVALPVDGGWSGSSTLFEGAGAIRAIGRVAATAGQYYVSRHLALFAQNPPEILRGPGQFGFIDGAFRITVKGVPGQIVVLESSRNLIEWQGGATRVVGESGLAAFQAVIPVGAAEVFHRARLWP